MGGKKTILHCNLLTQSQMDITSLVYSLHTAVKLQILHNSLRGRVMSLDSG